MKADVQPDSMTDAPAAIVFAPGPVLLPQPRLDRPQPLAGCGIVRLQKYRHSHVRNAKCMALKRAKQLR